MLALFPDVFPDACLGLRLSCLRRVKDLKKTRLASAWVSCLRRVKDLKQKHVPGTKAPIYGIYRIYIYIYICIYIQV